ncbi:hypothetical protein MHH33_16820 [Paenisporosarcina sp. FSL H8-0542]|uniref:hypothetical protein n=1 Tax=Paenisporosarcina sp. FSL H8-0542 TaxID=2921401 RepID=UPI00315A6665
MRFIKWIVLFLFVLLLPLAIWLWEERHAQNLDIVILDKTVPNGDLREHKGLTWLLNHTHINKTNGDSYSEKEDYAGVTFDGKSESVRGLPEDLSSADMIYVADTYGIYESEQEKLSDKIEGGLSSGEWTSIHQAVDQNDVPLIMEFNSISSPTEPLVRKEVSKYLGFEQKGWTGRYFKELSNDNGEIPQWLVDSYEAAGNQKWSFAGEGLVFIEENTEMVRVLSLENGDVDEASINLTFTQNGEKKFNLDGESPYRYWFDITEAVDENNVLAYFELPVNKQGQALLDEWGIPSRFPAVIEKKQDATSSYYFAGDFVDTNDIPSIYQYSGITKVKEWFTFDFVYPEQSFFWKTYVPMMKVLLEDVKDVGSKDKQLIHKPSVLQNELGLNYSAKVNGDRFDVYTNGEWKTLTVKGVNIGMGKPGTFPGEAAITKGEYARWFKQIGEMNANTIRIYTLHPPAFYEALKEYNESHEKPLYVFHGVWIDEAPLEETLDAFTPEITDRFQKEFQKITDVIHGNAKVAKEPGHAYGTYKADISPYVIGWMIGIEWYPFMVDNMATKYKGMDQYNGEYIQTTNAVGFELWIAQQMDQLTVYEAETYKWTRPMSFTNWVSTDNIEQPAEPLEQEDLASVDPNHMHYKENLSMPGMFASYHVYPYYPDFLNLEERYTEYIDHRGEKNNYAGYLHDLKASHKMPVLIAEFGLPASRGLTHVNPFGWNQGFHTEQEQGNYLSSLYEDIIQEGMMGGLVFTWQDEWFKRTWNTMDLDNADRRPFWSNAQTNEQNFGLLNFDRMLIKTDGDIEDWADADPMYQSGKGPITALYATSDERFLYVRIDGKPGTDWLKNTKPQLLFDVSPGSGNDRVDELGDVTFNQPFADFWLSIQSTEEARMKVDAYYDVFYYQYGIELNMMDSATTKPTKNSGLFNEIRLPLNKGITRPDTGESFPFSSYETGKMRFGNSNPDSPDYDSLADYYVDPSTGVMEIRIPWLLLNIKDPSSKEVFGDVYVDGMDAKQQIDDIGIALGVTDNQGQVIQTFPSSTSTSISVDEVSRYRWEAWELPYSSERLKQSYLILQETFSKTP